MGVFPIIIKNKDFYSLASKLNYINYGGCRITVSTYGCGPYSEGSTPSFRPLKRIK